MLGGNSGWKLPTDFVGGFVWGGCFPREGIRKDGIFLTLEDNIFITSLGKTGTKMRLGENSLSNLS